MILTAYQLLQRYLEKTKDSTTDNSNLGKERINNAVDYLCQTHNFRTMRKTYTFDTVADQQYYYMPVDISKLTTVKVEVADKVYPIPIIDDPDKWNKMNIDSDVTSDYPTYCYYDAGRLGFYSVPSSTGNEVKINYLRRALPMENWTDYATGTIEVEQGSVNIVGTGTNFATITLNTNTHIIIKGIAYEIASITDGTNLILSQSYQGTDGSLLAYKIGDIPVIDEAFSDLCWIIPTREYYLWNKEDTQMLNTIAGVQSDLESRLRKATQTKTTSNVIQRKSWEIRTINDYPQSIGI
jgi:hypothetical protein